MIFFRLPLEGVFLIEPERKEDERGFFARTFCQREFEAQGLTFSVRQCSVSFNKKRGTLRGMHFQREPYQETKLIRCTQGAIYDVVIDLRPQSPTFRKWAAAELTAENHHLLYVPEGFAHGFLTLAPATEIFYQISEFYRPDHAAGVRWDDPVFGIDWPAPVHVISARDRTYPDFPIS